MRPQNARMQSGETIEQLLARARRHDASGEDDRAKALFMELLGREPTHLDALLELGNLAYATGHRSAARTAYLQAVRLHPNHPAAHLNLGNLCFADDDLAAAREYYLAALAQDADLVEAHQGLARILGRRGESAAAVTHLQKGFGRRPVHKQRYRGPAAATRVLLLIATDLGNIPTGAILDDRQFEVTALYPEFYAASEPLPPHDVIFNAIGDADLCHTALQRARTLSTATTRPVINAPARVLPTGRVDNASRLAALPDVISPKIRQLSRAALQVEDKLRFPLLLRAPGFHTGMHFVRVEGAQELAVAMSGLPGEQLLAIECLDARGADGLSRKYRVMFIDGELYPLHLAVSHHWKVHYFSAAMSESELFRAEERRFLDAMPTVLGGRIMAALEGIAACLQLDYGGIDFALSPDGRLQLFEANATMVIIPPPPAPIWDYRRAAIRRALQAARDMVQKRALG